MSNLIYNRFKRNLLQGIHKLDDGGNTIKVALMKTGHSNSTAADNVWADVSANELSNDDSETTNYEQKTLAGMSVTQGATTKWDATDTEWTSASFTAFYGVLYDDTPAVAGNIDPLICSFDFDGGKEVSSGTFKIVWNVDGILTLT